jgi:RsiW-degrading membrane proteinase PrsW (M82 family)
LDQVLLYSFYGSENSKTRRMVKWAAEAAALVFLWDSSALSLWVLKPGSGGIDVGILYD